MDISRFGETKTGELVRISGGAGATYAFIPNPLPPQMGVAGTSMALC